jgi:hypothetical protein
MGWRSRNPRLQSVTSAERQTIGWIDKFLMKALDCIETPLMAAFGAAGALR